mmetsp:Transcript_28822/g.75974  ORF Transcript_28822/g.75974 Transcript_28822/m.75974 type:complete len:239 (-) Transcript_28822:313-1029(-)
MGGQLGLKTQLNHERTLFFQDFFVNTSFHLFGKGEEDGHHRQVVRAFSALPLMHNVKLCRGLPPVHHVLGGHMKVELPHIIDPIGQSEVAKGTVHLLVVPAVRDATVGECHVVDSSAEVFQISHGHVTRLNVDWRLVVPTAVREDTRPNVGCVITPLEVAYVGDVPCLAGVGMIFLMHMRPGHHVSSSISRTSSVFKRMPHTDSVICLIPPRVIRMRNWYKDWLVDRRKRIRRQGLRV